MTLDGEWIVEPELPGSCVVLYVAASGLINRGDAHIDTAIFLLCWDRQVRPRSARLSAFAAP